MIATNYESVCERIAAAARSVGRDPQDVHLVVVTKGHSLEAVRQVLNAGARCLGENYVEEAMPKIQATRDYRDLEWHMVGHVQSRKAKLVCENFSRIDSVDSLKLARRLDRFAGETGKTLPILLEFNVSGEDTKFGWEAYNPALWHDLLSEFEEILNLSQLSIDGLMTMPPLLPDPENSRPYFRRLCQLRDFLASHFPHLEWKELSMGMSADYEIAIQEGATMVRVGTAIMGERISIS